MDYLLPDFPLPRAPTRATHTWLGTPASLPETRPRAVAIDVCKHNQLRRPTQSASVLGRQIWQCACLAQLLTRAWSKISHLGLWTRFANALYLNESCLMRAKCGMTLTNMSALLDQFYYFPQRIYIYLQNCRRISLSRFTCTRLIMELNREHTFESQIEFCMRARGLEWDN